MIRNDQEFQDAAKRCQEEKVRLDAHRKQLKKEGFAGKELQRLMDPLESFHFQLQEEVESYERLKRGELSEVTNWRSIGQALVSLRIARDISQAELALRLGVSPSQVSRDERNEYHGATLERVAKTLEALEVGVKLQFDLTPTTVAN